MSDLIESRISEIRAEAKSVIDAGYRVLHVNASDLEALLAEREGMKAEIERLNARLAWRDHRDSCHPCGSHVRAMCEQGVEIYSRAQSAAPLDPKRLRAGLNDDDRAFVEQTEKWSADAWKTSQADVRRLLAILARLSAPLDPSSAPSEDFRVYTQVLQRFVNPDLRTDKRARTDELAVLLRLIRDQQARIVELERRSPDREAGSGTDDEPGVTANVIAELEDAAREAEGHGEFLRENRFRDAIRIVRLWSPEAAKIADEIPRGGPMLVRPSEGGGE